VSQTVLVTGAAGFAGSHLLDQLERTPAEVIAWRRPADPLPAGRTGHEIPWMLLDLLDRVAVRAAIADVRPSVIYHCAGAAHVGASWARSRETLAVNALCTHHLIDAVRRSRLSPRILVPGSAMIYRELDRAIREDDPFGPQSPYGISKLAQEMIGARAVTDDGIEVLLTRSFNHLGPRQDPAFFAAGVARQIATIEAGLAEPVIAVGNLSTRRDLTDVRDTVRAYRLLIERGRPGVFYNVCSGEARAMSDVLAMMLSVSRVPIEVRVDPSRYRPHDAPLVLGDPTRIRAETGWAPEIPFERSIADLLDFWRQAVRGPNADRAIGH
jgi:GDP-4-dehydro-6-deoxy-D-mannose reductase